MNSKPREKPFNFEQKNMPIETMSAFKEYRKKGIFCDVVLKAGDREFLAHRNILGATIPYFNTMFTSEYMESKQRVIVIQNIDPASLETLIDFSYSGKIQIDPQRVQKLMIAADFVQLLKVKNACAKYLKSTIQAVNVLGIKKLANLLRCQQLVSAADEFISENFSKISGTNDFLMLEFEELEELIRKDDLCCTEDNVFNAAMKWVKYQEAEREHHLTEILSKVRLSLVSTEYLVNVVSSEELILSSLERLRIVDKVKSDRLIQGEHSFTQKTRRLVKFTYLVPIIAGNQLKIYDASKSEWLHAEYLENWLESTVVLSGSKIYIFKDSVSRNNVSIYDLETKKWSKGADMIIKRSGFGASTLNDNIYVCGGSHGFKMLSSVDCYSIKENRWQSVAPMTKKRSGVGVVSLNGYIYVIGGFRIKEEDTLSLCEKYDPTTNTWTDVQPLLASRFCFGVAALNNKIYVAGGFVCSQDMNFCEVYDPSLDSWSIVAPMNERRYKLSLSAINGKLYAVGGCNENGYSSSSIEVYSPETDSWEILNHN